MKITYDQWHFIIPVLWLVIWIPVTFNLKISLNWKLMWLAECNLGLIAVAFFYEWKQFTDLKMEETYESWKAARLNSLTDIKYFITGLFTGNFLGFLIFGILLHI